MRFILLMQIALTLFTSIGSAAQVRPDLGSPPDPGRNRVEVRFAMDKRTVKCQSFFLSMSTSRKTLLKGNFSSSFELPLSFPPSIRTVDVRASCGKHSWHFSRVPRKSFVEGWRWIGTDHPPFQTEFSGPVYSRCRAIRYLLVSGSKEDGLDYFETTPRTVRIGSEVCTGD